MTMDIRLLTHFALTTINVVLDIIHQDENKIYLGGCAVFRLALMMVTYLWPSKQCTNSVRRSMGVAYMLSVVYWFEKLPFTWESTFWSLQTDLVLALWLFFGDTKNRSSVNLLSSTITSMFCCYYTAAGFFKINSHFLDPDASCATVFAVMHTAYYAGPFLSQEALVDLCRMLKPWSPVFTIAVEMAMGILLTIGQLRNSQWWRKVGLMTILYFHLAVCGTPKPLDISNFAYQCAARLILAHHPDSLRAALLIVHSHDSVCLTLAVFWIAYGVQTNFTPPNWSFACFVPLLGIHQLSISANISTEHPVKSQVSAPTTSPRSYRSSWWSVMAVSGAAFYAFGCICLGLMEEASTNMFANLKIHGGSNHLLVPTGLLLQNRPEIRIDNTTSHWFMTTYPADFTNALEPNPVTVEILEAIDNPAPAYFNGGANRVLGIFRKGWMKHNGVFIPYSVPSIEFQRLFSEALIHDTSFSLTYSELPTPPVNNEVWRATAVQRQIHVIVQNGKITQCTTLLDRSNKQSSSCNVSTDLVYTHKEMSWWSKKFSMYHGYPIVYEKDGSRPRKSISCFGP